ncbi:hypothetical protein, partial [Labrys sp. ZIDIC5]|uniref:hypothetical protein n=1 Tax=Labrys sedimenti TaxID=3106036 RepID=UPI002ACA3E4F
MTSSTGGTPSRPALPKEPLLSFLLASSTALICQSVQAQVTAGGGQTVEITQQQATCNAAVCFVARDQGSLLYANADTPIDVTVPNGQPEGGPLHAGVQARDGGTVRLDGGGTIRVGRAGWGVLAGPFTPSTIAAIGLTLDIASESVGIAAYPGSTITLDGTTTLTGRDSALAGLWAQNATVTLNGPLQASGDLSAIARAEPAGIIDLRGGGSIAVMGSAGTIFSSSGGRISMRGMTVRADTNTAFGTSLFLSNTDKSAFTVTDSTFEGVNAGGLLNGLYAFNPINATALTLDNSQIKLNSAGTGLLVEGSYADVTLSRGSAITAFASNRGGLLARIAGFGGVTPDRGKLTLKAQDSTLSGNVQVEASGEAGVNEFGLRLDGSALWRGNVTVGRGSRSSVAIAGTSRWIGSANNATTVVLSSANALWAIPGGGNSTVSGTVKNAGKIAFQAGGPTTLT